MKGCEDVALSMVEKIVGAGYLALEFWLGRTKRVKANSTIDLALGLLAAILKKKPKT